MAFEFVKNVTGILAQTQDKINRQFLKRIEDLEKKSGTDETSIADLETTVGDSTGGLVKKVKDVEDAIGDADTSGTILYRIKALEDAANGGGGTE